MIDELVVTDEHLRVRTTESIGTDDVRTAQQHKDARMLETRVSYLPHSAGLLPKGSNDQYEAASHFKILQHSIRCARVHALKTAYSYVIRLFSSSVS